MPSTNSTIQPHRYTRFSPRVALRSRSRSRADMQHSMYYGEHCVSRRGIKKGEGEGAHASQAPRARFPLRPDTFGVAPKSGFDCLTCAMLTPFPERAGGSPIHFCARVKREHLQTFGTFISRPRPKCGLGCPVCVIFARQRHPTLVHSDTLSIRGHPEPYTLNAVGREWHI